MQHIAFRAQRHLFGTFLRSRCQAASNSLQRVSAANVHCAASCTEQGCDNDMELETVARGGKLTALKSRPGCLAGSTAAKTPTLNVLVVLPPHFRNRSNCKNGWSMLQLAQGWTLARVYRQCGSSRIQTYCRVDGGAANCMNPGAACTRSPFLSDYRGVISAN